MCILKTNVLLYGNAIFLNGLAVELQRHTCFKIHFRQTDGAIDLNNIAAIIVDLNEYSLAHLLTQVVAPASVKFVGVNVADSRVTVLTRNTHQTNLLADIPNFL